MEQKNDVQMIMIPLKEYRRLVRKIEKLKLALKAMVEKADNRYEWWQEEETKRKKLEQELWEANRKIAELTIEEFADEGQD